MSVYSNEWNESFPLDTATLTVTRKGSTSRRFRIDIAMAPLLAGCLYLEDAMCAAMVDKDALKPERSPLTEEQKAAWDHLIKVGGDSFKMLSRPSYHDIVKAGTEELTKHMQHVLQDPTVADAYNAFMTTVKLKPEKDNIV